MRGSLRRWQTSTSSGGTSASPVSGCCGTARSASVRRSSTKSSTPSRTARHKHPHGAQAFLAGPRPVSLAGVPHLHASRSAAPHLASGVPAVRSTSGQSQQQQYRPSLPVQDSPRVEEDQAGLAGCELLNRSGTPDRASFDPGHRAAQSRPARPLDSLFPPQGLPLTAPRSRRC